jgi:thioredoxin 2
MASEANPSSAASEGTPRPSSSGPQSILTCTNCSKKNKIRPSERGSPHCGECGEALPWLVNATDRTFPAEAASSVAVVVDLWAPWCGPCRIVGPILESLSKEYAGRLKVVKVNVDENPGLSQQFQATSIPTLMVLKDGQVVDRIVGALPQNDLKMRLFPYLMRS